MTYNFHVDMRRKLRPYNPFNMLALLIGLIVSNLTTLAVIVWSVGEPDIREGWRKVFQRIKESRSDQYDSDKIQAFFRQYWELVDDIHECTNLHDWKKLHVEIEAFEKIYTDEVPEALLNSKTDTLLKIHNNKFVKVSA
jgi:hypothetical protein